MNEPFTRNESDKPDTVFLCILRFTLCIGILAAAACSSNTPYKADPTKPLVSRPGVIAVDVEARKQILGPDGVMQVCSAFNTDIPLLLSLDAPTGYGLDARYNQVSAAFREVGAACFAGQPDACLSVQQSAYEWARSYPVSRPDKNNIFNDTLTVNMRLLVPMIAALGIAEALTPLSSQYRSVIDPWLGKLVKNFEHGMRRDGSYNPASRGISSRKAAHNHAMMSSLAAMSYGAWVGSDKNFLTGLEQWDLTLNSMRSDGSLPIETRRGARALFYQGRAIAALIQIAERAHVQGIDLYTRAPSANKTLHQTVGFFIDAVNDPDVVLRYAKRNFAPGPNKNYKQQYLGGSSSLSWVAPYIARFPEHPNTKRLLQQSPEASYLAQRLIAAVKSNGASAEWIGIDARCFYANAN